MKDLPDITGLNPDDAFKVIDDYREYLSGISISL